MSDVQTQEEIHMQAARAPRSRKNRIVVAAIAGGILAASGIAYSVMSGKDVSTDDAYPDGRAINVAPHVAGYVAALDVTDNQFVHQGQVLIELQCTDYMAASVHAQGDLESTEGQLAGAKAELELARITFPAGLAKAQASVDTQRANLFKTQSEFVRQHDIPPEAATSHNIDYATADRKAAESQVEEALAQKRIAEPVDLKIAAAAAHVNQLQGEVKRAQGDLEQANLNVGWCDIRAPQTGWITKREVEQGDYVQVGQQLFSIVSPEVWVTANFKENELTHMRAGQHVSIAVDAYPRLKLKGHVDSIQLGSGGRFTAFPAENATGNFVKIVQRVPVKIVIDSGMNPSRPLPLNLSVEPTVELR
jgi:membrane fusion protein (multidrug efflux system)